MNLRKTTNEIFLTDEERERRRMLIAKLDTEKDPKIKRQICSQIYKIEGGPICTKHEADKGLNFLPKKTEYDESELNA